MSTNFDVEKFEKALVEEHNFLAKSYNREYAGKTVYGNDVVKGKVLEAKCDVLMTIIDALRSSIK